MILILMGNYFTVEMHWTSKKVILNGKEIRMALLFPIITSLM